MANVDQKKYLKKYLDDDHSKKRKKKKRSHSGSYSDRVKIIDDDGEHRRKRNYDDENDLMLTGEDAPQIVGMVDDRPPELKAAEDFRNNSKWKSIPSSSADDRSRNNDRHRDEHRKQYERRSRTPPRKDSSPKRVPDRSKETSSAAAVTRRRHDSDDDYSPARRRREPEKPKPSVSAVEKDLSPVRRRNKNGEEDLSPARKPKHSALSDADLSPKRRGNIRNTDLSPKRRTYRNSPSNDLSPVRKRAKSKDLSPVRRRKDEDDNSPPRRFKKPEAQQDRKRRDSSSDDEPKAKRTLDGKRAGLQDAATLKKEIDEHRRREEKRFAEMASKSSSGGRGDADAELVVRDKRSGRVRDLEKDREKERQKEEREKERKEVYSRWGKGVKQVEDYRNRMADAEYEGSKPLARYSDDADLDKMLKDQERAGDPMLQYIREKKAKTSTVPKVPIYNGPFPENRFNIRPGYRWDGVDRSNGYEKKWLDVQNQKIAIREEAYKYSTEDM